MIAAARSTTSTVSCNVLTTWTFASRTTDTNVIMLPGMSTSCGCWLTCRRWSTTISLRTKTFRRWSTSISLWTKTMNVSSGRWAVPLHTAIRTHSSVQRTHLSVHVAPLTPWVPFLFALDQRLSVSTTVAECLIRSAVNISHPRQQKTPSASLSAASGPGPW